MLTIGDIAPDFKAETSEGRISFYDWMEDKWAILFSHPKDFTPVCTTELGEAERYREDFGKRNVKIIGLSVDATASHRDWAKDIEDVTGYAPDFPIIGDENLLVSKLFGMLPADANNDAGGRTAADNATVRTVFVIAPDKTIRMAMAYPMSSGRNFEELLRVIDSLQLTANRKVATPANWTPGDDVFILPSVSDEEAALLFGTVWRAPKPYIRVISQSQAEGA